MSGPPSMSVRPAPAAQYEPSLMGGLPAMKDLSRSAPHTARYDSYKDNPIKQTAKDPLTTFGLDVDTASYANVRRFLAEGSLPHPSAVRVEELLNYFPMEKEKRPLNHLGTSPFEAAYELAPSPWNANNVLLSLTVKASGVDSEEAPPANLVFLVDVSGSMDSPERLPLVQDSLKLLVKRLRPQDKISLVTYAGATRVVLGPTSGQNKEIIAAAIENLQAEGGTAGGAGLRLAYQQAEESFVKGGVNRILLCTDGDFNLGMTSTEELLAMVIRERGKGVTLSSFGFGTDNYNDAMMVKIADAGNGNYSYIDTLWEARKILDDEMHATLVTIAKDVKAQIEFNPSAVLEYRQIGYEKRQLQNEDFNDDKVDSGDIGAGKRVTVLYELTLVGKNPSVDPARYPQNAIAKKSGDTATSFADELAFVKLRWKAPTAQTSAMVSFPILRSALALSFDRAEESLRFSAAVAAYGQKLRQSAFLTDTAWNDIATWADQAKGKDSDGYRAEFVQLVRRAGKLDKASPQ